MLNPSIANHEIDDPTIRRIVGRSNKFGYTGIIVCNLYAYICTDSAELFKDDGIDYIGAENNYYIKDWLRLCEVVIFACGNKVDKNRLNEVYKLVKKKPCYCLKLNKTGFPTHPLYLRNDEIKLQEFKGIA